MVRQRSAVTVLGGPHARCYPEDACKYFDYVLGFTDKQLLHRLRRGKQPFSAFRVSTAEIAAKRIQGHPAWHRIVVRPMQQVEIGNTEKQSKMIAAKMSKKPKKVFFNDPRERFIMALDLE